MIDYKPKQATNISEGFANLFEILSLLRSPEGCPWDRQETVSSSLINLRSELYETLDEIAKDNKEGVKEEMGDVLLNVVMALIILQQEKQIDPTEIFNRVVEKLYNRHPHVFSSEKADSPKEALDVWNRQKKKEGKGDGYDYFARLPKSFTVYEKAEEVMKKSIASSFTWPSSSSCLEQVESEVKEVREEIEKDPIDIDATKMEVGDMILTAICFAVYQNYEASGCLSMSLNKFEDRFNLMRKYAAEDGIEIKKGCDLDMSIMGKYWIRAKNELLRNAKEEKTESKVEDES